jgi:hypothetical protein
MKHKCLSILLITLTTVISACVHTNKIDYNNIMTKQVKMMPLDLINQLEEQKVIIMGDPIFVDVLTIEGVNVSKVVISSELVPDPEKRFFIAHLIRNILIHGAIIYNYDDQGNNFVMYPVVDVSEDFIYENRQMICDVIYYLLHKDYFNFSANSGSSEEKIFYSKLLTSIDSDVNQLKSRLLKENAIISISGEITSECQASEDGFQPIMKYLIKRLKLLNGYIRQMESRCNE